jgi:hypothetical protein
MLNILQDQLTLFMTKDEAHFYLNGYVNKQNCRYRANGNPRDLHQDLFYNDKVTIECTLSKVEIIEPYFL